jgi:hypothetical protein
MKPRIKLLTRIIPLSATFVVRVALYNNPMIIAITVDAIYVLNADSNIRKLITKSFC